MYIHLLHMSLHFLLLFFVWGKCVIQYSQLAQCVVLLSEVSWNVRWLKAVPDDEFEAQCMLCKRTLNLGTLGVNALVLHTKSEKHHLRRLCCLAVKQHSNHLQLNSNIDSGGALDFARQID